MKRIFLMIALQIERALDWIIALFLGPRKLKAVIDPYLGYSTPDTLVARGRLLTSLRGRAPRAGQGRFANFRQMMSLFHTDEIAGVVVTGGGVKALSDEEGYFTLAVPRPANVSGWVDIEAGAEGATTMLPVQVSSDEAVFGIISDIDDTMIYTGAWQLWRNLWNSFTGNIATRQVFEDAVAMMDALSTGGRNPVFYVSSSPWNFSGFLEDVSARAGLVRGPRFLRDLGLNETSALGGSHHSHKGRAIDSILAANPDLPFILIGDTGQADASVYAHAADRHVGRISRVILRVAGKEASMADVDAMRSRGIVVDVVETYGPLTHALAEHGPLPKNPTATG